MCKRTLMLGIVAQWFNMYRLLRRELATWSARAAFGQGEQRAVGEDDMITDEMSQRICPPPKPPAEGCGCTLHMDHEYGDYSGTVHTEVLILISILLPQFRTFSHQES